MFAWTVSKTVEEWSTGIWCQKRPTLANWKPFNRLNFRELDVHHRLSRSLRWSNFLYSECEYFDCPMIWYDHCLTCLLLTINMWAFIVMYLFFGSDYGYGDGTAHFVADLSRICLFSSAVRVWVEWKACNSMCYSKIHCESIIYSLLG